MANGSIFITIVLFCFCLTLHLMAYILNLMRFLEMCFNSKCSPYFFKFDSLYRLHHDVRSLKWNESEIKNTTTPKIWSWIDSIRWLISQCAKLNSCASHFSIFSTLFDVVFFNCDKMSCKNQQIKSVLLLLLPNYCVRYIFLYCYQLKINWWLESGTKGAHWMQ